MKTAQERGPFGAWLVDQRRRLGEERGTRVKAQEVVEELAAQGYPIDPAYYRALEGGSKKPGRETREALARFFGRQPPEVEPTAPPDISRLVAALEAQTEAVNRLIEVVANQAGPDPERLAEQMGEALAAHLAPLLASAAVDQPTTAAQP